MLRTLLAVFLAGCSLPAQAALLFTEIDFHTTGGLPAAPVRLSATVWFDEPLVETKFSNYGFYDGVLQSLSFNGVVFDQPSYARFTRSGDHIIFWAEGKNAAGDRISWDLNFYRTSLTLSDIAPTFAILLRGQGAGSAYGGASIVSLSVDQAILDVAGVPESASWAMMISGFALVGAAMRRRKVAVSFA